ncbi:hypothetical protein Hypma_007795 [Hypsizygus marmoreus]|uniref:Uncharacterized protein n=1 Tax=Hypsizygus marmoreus TaxID=39966 RepID=A0A369JTW4_HYPMA|nr:hypothetical protein Hypma_007795 [Hypsizygus marmoreus]
MLEENVDDGHTAHPCNEASPPTQPAGIQIRRPSISELSTSSEMGRLHPEASVAVSAELGAVAGDGRLCMVPKRSDDHLSLECANGIHEDHLRVQLQNSIESSSNLHTAAARDSTMLCIDGLIITPFPGVLLGDWPEYSQSDPRIY